MEVQRFDVRVTWEGDHPIVYVQGDLDYGNAATFQAKLDELLELGASSLTVDMRDVTFLDSEGVMVLLRSHTRLLGRKGFLEIRECSRRVARVFHILGLDKYSDMCVRERENRV